MADRPSEGAFTNVDGLKIFCKYWYPDNQDIRALVVLIHGLGEHCARYNAVANSFTSMGCLVFAHDHIGHGCSEGTRVDVSDFQKYVNDCMQHVDLVSEKHPNLPIIVYGHSMGGTVAVLTMNSNPNRFAGAIFGSPCIRLDPAQASPFLVTMAKIVGYLCPQLPVTKLKVSNLSRDPAVVEDYTKDPLVWHGGVKARWAAQMYYATMKIQSEYHKATYPFLIQHGTKDELCDVVGSDLFFENAASKNKVYKRYEGYFHELDKEPEEHRGVIFKDIEEWTRDLLSSLGSSKENGIQENGNQRTEPSSPSSVQVEAE